MANNPKGHANVISVLLLIGLIIAGIWTWNHLSFDTQDYIIDEIIPILFLHLSDKSRHLVGFTKI